MRVLVVVALLAAPVASVTPVEKVIGMLNSMKAKAGVEKEEEMARFKEFEKFCNGAARAKVRSIEENKNVIGKLAGEIDGLGLEVDQLAAEIEKADADIGLLHRRIKTLDAKANGINAEEEEITEERKEEHAVFAAKDGDYADSVDSLDRAVREMDQVTLTQTGAKRRIALLQIAAQTLPKISAAHPAGWAKREIDSFLQRDPELGLLSAPTGEAAAYEGQSGGIKELFQGLEEKLADERTDGQRSESDEKHLYEVMMLQLNSQLKEATYDREKKAAAQAQAQSDMAAAQGDKASTEKALADDEKYLAELKAECEAKTKAFEERQATREGEITAIGQATEILAGKAVSGAAATHLPAFLQKQKKGKTGRALAQFRSNVNSPIQRRVAGFLQNKAMESGSRMLSELALRVAQDPFGKVTKMIRDMIAKLTAEANEEAEQKGFCDAELSANKATREEKTANLDSLNAQIEELTATESKLAQDIAHLSESVAELSAALQEATALRQTEKAKNVATIADAKAATEAVQQATNVLREFYAQAAFVQKGATAQKKGYSGAQDSASGVMNFLEVVQSDFVRLEEETTADEQQASGDFSAFAADTNVAMESNNADIKAKTTKKTGTAKDLNIAKTDAKNTQGELVAAMDYYDKLKPSCVDAGISYEERVARRKAEIESLRDASGILAGTDVAV